MTLGDILTHEEVLALDRAATAMHDCTFATREGQPPVHGPRWNEAKARFDTVIDQALKRHTETACQATT